MTTPTRWFIAVVLTTGIAIGQQKSDVRANVLTVCEVLADVDHYREKAVVVVGRMERSVSLIDHYEFLSQDRCDHPGKCGKCGTDGDFSDFSEIR